MLASSHPSTANSSKPIKSCLKKATVEEPVGDSRRSLLSALRRASLPRHHRTGASSDLAPESEANRRASGSLRSLLAALRRSSSSHAVATAHRADKEAGRESVVRFGRVCIREYDVTASHHPGGLSGVPIELGWRYNVLDPVDVDDFESRRSATRCAHIHEKKLTPRERQRILRQFGVSEREIMEAAKRAAIARGERRRSLALRHRDGLHEKIEVFCDGFKYAFGCKKRVVLYAVESRDSGLHLTFWNDESILRH